MDGFELGVHERGLDEPSVGPTVRVLNQVVHQCTDVLRRWGHELRIQRVPVVATDPVLHGALPAVLLVREQGVVKIVDSRRGDRRRGREIARRLAQSRDVVRDERSVAGETGGRQLLGLSQLSERELLWGYLHALDPR